jgi:flagellar hook-length control protein FliK
MPTAPTFQMPPQLASNLLDMGVPQQVGSKAWTEAVAQRVMWMVQGDQQFARLKLNPPNLGPLEVRVSVNQDQTNVAFLAQHAPVREALEAALPRLREMFDQSSLQLVRADVSDPGAQQRGNSNGSAAEHAPRQGAGPGADPVAQSGDVGFSSDERQAVGSSGLVDLFA